MAIDDLGEISDEALYDRSKGMTTLIEKQAIAMNKIHNELWRRYKNKKKECDEISKKLESASLNSWYP